MLSRYFIDRYLGLFLTVLVAALLLLCAVELVLRFDSLGSSVAGSSEAAGAGLDSIREGALALANRLLAYYLPDLLPVASLVAAFLTFATAGRSQETLALEAGGVRIGRVILPVLLTALMLSLASGILHETLILRAERNLQVQGAGTAQPIDFGRKEFWFQKGRTITNIAQADAANRMLIDVEIFEKGTDGRMARVIRAARVRIEEDGRWALEDARIWRFDSRSPDAAPALESHAKILLDLDAMAGETLLGAEPGFLPILSLAQYIESPHATFPSRKQQIIQRYHERLSRPWLIFVFAWIALPFGLMVDQAGRLIGPAMGVAGATGLFFMVRGMGETLSAQGILGAAPAVWLPSVLLILPVAWLLRRRGV